MGSTVLFATFEGSDRGNFHPEQSWPQRLGEKLVYLIQKQGFTLKKIDTCVQSEEEAKEILSLQPNAVALVWGYIDSGQIRVWYTLPPGDPVTEDVLGHTYQAAPDSSASEFHSFVQRAGDMEYVLNLLAGVLLLKKGANKDAEEALSAAIAKAPKTGERAETLGVAAAYTSRAYARLYLGKPLAALHDLEHADRLTKNPEIKAAIDTNRGYLYHHAFDNRPKALREYRDAVDLNPDSLTFENNLQYLGIETRWITIALRKQQLPWLAEHLSSGERRQVIPFGGPFRVASPREQRPEPPDISEALQSIAKRNLVWWWKNRVLPFLVAKPLKWAEVALGVRNNALLAVLSAALLILVAILARPLIDTLPLGSELKKQIADWVLPVTLGLQVFITVSKRFLSGDPEDQTWKTALKSWGNSAMAAALLGLNVVLVVWRFLAHI